MPKKPPERPEDIYDELVADLQHFLLADLLGVAVFGSAATGRYHKGKSDINLMVLLDDDSGHQLGRLIEFCQRWRPAGVATPLVVTPEYLRTSQDVFPIEFMVMADGHKCIYGEDPLAGVEIDPSYLRLQLERELKGKIMAVRSRLMASDGKQEALLALVREAVPAFTALFKAYLKLTTGSFPERPGAVMEAVAKSGASLEHFQRLGAVVTGGLKLKAEGLVELIEGCLRELGDMARRVDRLELTD